MAKYKLACAGSALVAMLGAGVLAPVAWAESVTVSDYEGLNAALCAGGDIVVGADINVDNWLATGCDYVIMNDTTIDFSGHKIISDSAHGYNIDVRGGTLTFKDSVGGGGYIQEGSGNIAIAVTSAKFVLNGSTVSSVDWGVVAWHHAEVEVNNGTIATQTDAAISGNGTVDPENQNYGEYAKVTVNGGSVISNGSTAIYAPQKNGIIAVSGGTVHGRDAGIEIRAGQLDITGGEVSSDNGVEYGTNPNGSGSTTTGAAVAVAQHTTRLPLSVNISGGEFTGPVAFSERNPQVNSEENIERVAISITGGNFMATNGDPIVVSEDVDRFISGGVFNKPFDSSYLAEGYSAYGKPQDVWTVDVAQEADLPDKIVIAKGETYTIEPGSVIVKYLVGGIVDKEIATSDGLAITGVAAGETAFTAQLHAIDEDVDVPIPVYVYDLDDKDADVHVDIVSDQVDANYIESEYPGATEAFIKAAGDKKIAGYYEINATLCAGNNAIPMSELNGLAMVTFELPDDLSVVASGFVRHFYMLRYHNGEVSDPIAVTDNGDGTGSFENDEFSAFVLTYEDVEGGTSAPETGTVTAAGASAMSASLMAAVAVGLLTSIVSFACLIRRR